jgi:hypothetical protein
MASVSEILRKMAEETKTRAFRSYLKTLRVVQAYIAGKN